MLVGLLGSSSMDSQFMHVYVHVCILKQIALEITYLVKFECIFLLYNSHHLREMPTKIIEIVIHVSRKC